MSRRAFVTLPDGVWTVLDKEFRGVLGDGDSEVIRNIIIAYLTDKGYLIKSRTPATQSSIGNELKIHEVEIAALVEVLNNSIKPHGSFYEAYKSEVDKIVEQQV
jgi:hypothetical protein